MPSTPMVSKRVTTPTAFAARSVFLATISHNRAAVSVLGSHMGLPFRSCIRLDPYLMEMTYGEATTITGFQQERAPA